MSVIDEVLQANEVYARTHELRRLTPRPERKLAVLTCMDTRLSIRTLGLKTGDAHIIRNAGGLITEDALRSLVISQNLLNTNEVLIIEHTDCGMLTFKDDEFRRQVQDETGVKPEWAAEAFDDLDDDVRQSIARIESSPFIPRKDQVRGFVYEVETGRLREVT
jgi:carbonic anhydrase